ncbi:MAG: hypothetical protein IPF81_14295 [Bacteroidetes bacterium]|nr:hypothetical protein [Bacteroidota bacterium]
MVRFPGDRIKCYVVGGNGHDDLMEYDPANDHWTARASIPQGITMFGMGFVCNGKGYLCGGNGPNFTYYQSLWEYDPDFKSMDPTERFPLPESVLQDVLFLLVTKGM